ncbi:pilus assembly protein [Xanthomonas translucens]|uniref:pilus assembly protein n=1 Tax=Xanthomonas campestris pv. translucens TaxID=343 RepID=UPI000D2108FB|nr:pilus assembly protein [Xanthomonas translucens]AVY65073.1 pilus assembly protein [Xanthomonas translucens pv. undulosa]
MKHQRRHISFGRRQFGQGMTEYIIIVALIAIAAIGVFTFFGGTVRSQVAGMAQELSGKDADQMIQRAGTRADKAQGQADKDKGMAAYNGNK